MSQISFAPRYETSFLEFSMPLSIYQFKYPHIGLYARVGAIGIGSDWLSSLIGNRDFNGMDFYFNIKLQLKKGDCRHGSSFNESCGGNSKRFRWSF